MIAHSLSSKDEFNILTWIRANYVKFGIVRICFSIEDNVVVKYSFFIFWDSELSIACPMGNVKVESIWTIGSITVSVIES